MPPRRKAAKKTVRKPKSKTQTPPPDPQPVPDVELEPEPTPAAVDAETPFAADAGATATEPAGEAAVQETPAPESVAKETLAPESSAVTETLETVTKPSNEALAEEASASAAAETPETAEASAETEKKEIAGTENEKKTRTVIRVRKVIKKRIVKKLVPKTAAVAKEIAKVIEEEEAAGAGKASEQPVLDNPKEEITEIVPEATKDEVKVDDVEPETRQEDEKVGDVELETLIEEGKVGDAEMEVGADEEARNSERKSRKKTEIFVGGLDRDAKEEDLRKVFGKVGEIVEVRMIMDGQSGKNKGYAFVRYADASQAKKAVTNFGKVEVCGKLCGASALKGNDTIYLGNIDKKWKQEDLMKLLQEIGIEKIEAVTVMSDPNNAGSNRGFAFLELETNKDAQNAFKKLQKKDAFGKGLNVKIAWAEPMNDPDEEEFKKVKSVYVEGIPSSWNEEKLRESFKKFGEIERLVLSRNIKSAKRKDFAFVNYSNREAALLCIKSFDKEELTDNDLKVNMKVSLAKPVQKVKQNKGGSKYSDKAIIKEKPKAVQRDTKATVSFSKVNSYRGVHTNTEVTRSSTNHELLNVLREQATWKPGQVGYAGGPSLHDYPHGVGGKRPFSSLGDEVFYSDPRGYPRARPESYPAAGPSYGSMPHGTTGSSNPYYQHQDPGRATGSYSGATDYPATNQMRQGAPPYGSGSYYLRHGF